MRQVFLAREEAQKRAPLQCVVVTNCATQRGILSFKGIEHRALRDWSRHFEAHLAVDFGERAQVRREFYADHDSVCTSTESTAGRSRTIGIHESPASAEA